MIRAMAWRLALLSLAACANASLPQTIAPPLPSPLAPADRSPRGLVLLRQTMLAAHNAARSAVGAPPLVWSDRLGGDAAIYADQLARTHVFAHAQQGATPEGENLWMGTRAAYNYDEMVAQWTAERRNYADAPVPRSSRTGQFGDVSHYTQMIWARTTEIGCSVASDADNDYLVCRYAPMGNVVGQRAR